MSKDVSGAVSALPFRILWNLVSNVMLLRWRWVELVVITWCCWFHKHPWSAYCRRTMRWTVWFRGTWTTRMKSPRGQELCMYIITLLHSCLSVFYYPTEHSIGRDAKFTVGFSFIRYVRLRISQPGLCRSAWNFARRSGHISDRSSPILEG